MNTADRPPIESGYASNDMQAISHLITTDSTDLLAIPHDADQANQFRNTVSFSVSQSHAGSFVFPKLPAELRLKTIHFTFEAQVIDVEIYPASAEPGSRGARRITPLPVGLQINRESRLESLRFYDRIQRIDDKCKTVWPVIYIHPTNDILKIITPWKTSWKSEQRRAGLGSYFDEVSINMARFSCHLNECYTRRLSLAFTMFYGDYCTPCGWMWMLVHCKSARSVFFSLDVFRRPETITLPKREEVEYLLCQLKGYRDRMKERGMRSPITGLVISTNTIQDAGLSPAELEGDIGVFTYYPPGSAYPEIGATIVDRLREPLNDEF
ncbi:hypothetical protein GLAREA_06672 [Glarea lozoyensis ATCC 20868]|uniref:2EXR domain-containing protein n=1 Tax=Glarea lozoyensis (strain ATCC 20868 / MF5171) TaxID=1116229 RepID=S3D956_GLAL2|nr:uncharacterized protein GLAREA_06672 [Glarea lozoyensis ATCC 20868]EPE33659.1 hypothetical protein GLAREA_06672 [Glarea lozoyensis ATCC 20868]